MGKRHRDAVHREYGYSPGYKDVPERDRGPRTTRAPYIGAAGVQVSDQGAKTVMAALMAVARARARQPVSLSAAPPPEEPVRE